MNFVFYLLIAFAIDAILGFLSVNLSKKTRFVVHHYNPETHTTDEVYFSKYLDAYEYYICNLPDTTFIEAYCCYRKISKPKPKSFIGKQK